MRIEEAAVLDIRCGTFSGSRDIVLKMKYV